MNNLIAKLQNEVNLSEEQSQKVIGLLKDYLTENEDSSDFTDKLKAKAQQLKEKVQQLKDTAEAKYENWTENADECMTQVGESISEVADKAGDKAEELLHKAKQKAKATLDKLSDMLDDDKTDR